MSFYTQDDDDDDDDDDVTNHDYLLNSYSLSGIVGGFSQDTVGNNNNNSNNSNTVDSQYTYTQQSDHDTMRANIISQDQQQQQQQPLSQYSIQSNASTNIMSLTSPGSTVKKKKKKASFRFVCENCGATDYYTDETSGDIVCSSCYTQSQAPKDATEMDIETIEAMGVRENGMLVTSSRYTAKQEDTTNSATGGYNQNGNVVRRGKMRKPLQDLDKSRPLPSLQECLEGFQHILKQCIHVVVEDLLSLSGMTTESTQYSNQDDPADQLKESIKSTVKHLWIGYLRAWRDGAEFYGKYHKEVRFCLRDQFLIGNKTRVAVRAHLASKAETELRKRQDRLGGGGNDNGGGGTTQSSNKSGIHDESGNESDHDSVSGNESDDTIPATNTSSAAASSRLVRVRGEIRAMLALYKNRRGRREMALKQILSLRMIASLLCVPLSRLGYSGRHVVEWIASGQMPILNAFDCLTVEQQDKLLPVQGFFRLRKLPLASAVEEQAQAFMFISGMKKESSPHGVLTTKSMPLLLARWVQDMGMRQRVLDLALALMGMDVPKTTDTSASTENWLPVALKKAKPELLSSNSRLAAVLVVACKMCPEWQFWTFGQTDEAAIVPWNSAHADRVQQIGPYIHFLEENGFLQLATQCPTLPPFLDDEHNHNYDGDDDYNNDGDGPEKDSRSRMSRPDEIGSNSIAGRSHDGSSWFENNSAEEAPDSVVSTVIGISRDHPLRIDENDNDETSLGTTDYSQPQPDDHTSNGVDTETIHSKSSSNDDFHKPVITQRMLRPIIHRDDTHGDHHHQQQQRSPHDYSQSHDKMDDMDVNGIGKYLLYSHDKSAISPLHPQHHCLVEYIAERTGTNPQQVHYYVSVLERDLEPLERKRRKAEFRWPSTAVHLCTDTILSSKRTRRKWDTHTPPKRKVGPAQPPPLPSRRPKKKTRTNKTTRASTPKRAPIETQRVAAVDDSTVDSVSSSSVREFTFMDQQLRRYTDASSRANGKDYSLDTEGREGQSGSSRIRLRRQSVRVGVPQLQQNTENERDPDTVSVASTDTCVTVLNFAQI